MRQSSVGEIVVWLAFACWPNPIASAQEVRVVNAQPGMVLISGGEFMMGAATNGHGGGEMAMPSNDAEPMHPVIVNDFWMDVTTSPMSSSKNSSGRHGRHARQRRSQYWHQSPGFRCVKDPALKAVRR